MTITSQQFTIEIPANHEGDMRGLAELDASSLTEQYDEAIKNYITERKAELGFRGEITSCLETIGGVAVSQEVVLMLPIDVIDDLRVILGPNDDRLTTEQLVHRTIVQYINQNYPIN